MPPWNTGASLGFIAVEQGERLLDLALLVEILEALKAEFLLHAATPPDPHTFATDLDRALVLAEVLLDRSQPRRRPETQEQRPERLRRDVLLAVEDLLEEVRTSS